MYYSSRYRQIQEALVPCHFCETTFRVKDYRGHLLKKHYRRENECPWCFGEHLHTSPAHIYKCFRRRQKKLSMQAAKKNNSKEYQRVKYLTGTFNTDFNNSSGRAMIEGCFCPGPDDCEINKDSYLDFMPLEILDGISAYLQGEDADCFKSVVKHHFNDPCKFCRICKMCLGHGCVCRIRHEPKEVESLCSECRMPLWISCKFIDEDICKMMKIIIDGRASVLELVNYAPEYVLIAGFSISVFSECINKLCLSCTY